MTSKDPSRSTPPVAHPVFARPSFSCFDQTAGSDPAPDSAKSHQSVFNTGFREWLRKVTSHDDGETQAACEQVRLEQLKQLLASMFGAHIASMSRRDLQLYLRLISASRLATIREVRFECFDLMCRKISEPFAVHKLHEIDILLQ